LRKLEFDSIFCDDIRQEVTNKQILIGVYASDMRVSLMPSVVPVSLWIRVQNLSAGKHPFSIKLLFEKSKGIIADVGGEIEMLVDGDPANIVLAGIPVNITDSDCIIAKISVDGSSMKKIGALRVRMA
jgi:hypothetical protein